MVDLDFNGYGQGTCTDENGDYRFSGIPHGIDFRVTARSQDNWCGGPENYIQEYWQETPDYNQATIFNLTPITNTYSNINFTLEQGGSISGYVHDNVDNPIPNAQVILWDSNGWWLGDTWTNASGTYALLGLSTGNYQIRVQADGYAMELYDNHVGYPFDFRNADFIPVLAGSQTADINFNLDDGGTIEVTVYDTDGTTPISGVPVDTNPGGFVECTDNEGKAYLKSLPLNTGIIVQAGGSWRDCSQLDRELHYYDDTIIYGDATPVTMTVPSEMRSISFTLPLGATITGTVSSNRRQQSHCKCLAVCL